MHNLTSCFVLGYHGCDLEIAKKLVLREEGFRKSENTYDWLGHGIYFWLENPRRACEWARRRKKKEGKFEPAVVGAVIDLGNCLDLTTTAGIEQIKLGYSLLSAVHGEMGENLPENDKAHDGDHDLLIRRLDCAVINMTCYMLEDKAPIDTVKGIFTEGGEAFPGACIKERTHTQICVRNPDCIKGIFFPPRELLEVDAAHCNDTRY